jgi:hypothetical protein
VTSMPHDNRSLIDLLKELSTESGTLVRKEIELAKAEMAEKASTFGRNAAYVGVGVFVALVGAMALLWALIYGLTTFLDQFMAREHAVWVAPLIIGVVITGIGYTIVQKGLHAIRCGSLTPDQTTQTLREDKQWLKEKLT